MDNPDTKRCETCYYYSYVCYHPQISGGNCLYMDKNDYCSRWRTNNEPLLQQLIKEEHNANKTNTSQL